MLLLFSWDFNLENFHFLKILFENKIFVWAFKKNLLLRMCENSMFLKFLIAVFILLLMKTLYKFRAQQISQYFFKV